jgi:D-3-phosphoglycerate dehydrogenase
VDPVSEEVIDNARVLKAVSKYGTGMDNIDVEAARKLGKIVAHVPEYCVDEVASHTLALILAGLRMLFPLVEAAKTGRWIEDPSTEKLRRSTSLTAGVLGLGRIGRRVAQCLHPLVDRILFYDPYVSERVSSRNGWESVDSITKLIKRTQILSLHAPLNEETYNLIDTHALARADGLVLVNTSRADLVHREALETALFEGRVCFYGSDVFWEEPPNYSDPGTVALLRRRDVLLTPHTAWYSEESEREVRRKAAEEILRALRGEQPLHGL